MSDADLIPRIVAKVGSADFERIAQIMSDYASGKPLPPRHHWVPRVFRRAEGFYIIDLPADDDLAVHARLNPGTLRIETVSGEQLWPPPPRIAQGTEAQRAETATKIGGSVHDGPVPEGNAP